MITISLTEYGLSFALSGLRIKSSLPIYISTDGSFVYPKLFPVSLLYYCIVYVNLIKDRSFVTLPFFRKAVAKVRSFSYILQIFAELFSKFFFGAELRSSLLKSGCKGKELFSNCQMFCEVFFRKFFRKSTGAREPSAWASLAKGGTGNPKTYRETTRKAYALQQHVKHHRFVSESGCKSTAYLRICKLIPTFFSHFPIGFIQMTDLQLCSIAGF